MFSFGFHFIYNFFLSFLFFFVCARQQWPLLFPRPRAFKHFQRTLCSAQLYSFPS